MQLTENTPPRWESVITDLTAKRQSTLQRLEQLRAERKALALDASLGDEAAAKRLRAINAELNRLSLEVDQFDTALSEAASGQRKAQAEADVQAELVRLTQIGQHLQKYYAEVEKIDDALQLLAEYFIEAREHLDHAESLMTATERAPAQQLRSLWGGTLAMAFHGLGDFVSLGREAAYIAHRKSLADFTQGIIERWIQRDASETEEETSNANQLHDLVISEISLVDRPANSLTDPVTGLKVPLSTIALRKRDATVDPPKKENVMTQLKLKQILKSDNLTFSRETIVAAVRRKAAKIAKRKSISIEKAEARVWRKHPEAQVAYDSAPTPIVKREPRMAQVTEAEGELDKRHASEWRRPARVMRKPASMS